MVSGIRTPGRPRDPAIDLAVLAVARRHLAVHGYDALSVAAVAAEAGTSRQALYRRWPTRAELAAAAVNGLSCGSSRKPTDDPRADLEAELCDLVTGTATGTGGADGLAMVGSLLHFATHPELGRLYRRRIIQPRRRRLLRILQRAVSAGRLPADADVDQAVAACIGALLALHLQGIRVGPDHARRTADLVWFGLGGRAERDQGHQPLV